MFLEDLERSRELYIRHQHVVTGPTRTGPAALPGAVTPTALTPTTPQHRLPQDDDDHSFPPTSP
ncbi:MAG: hypothetical protein IPK85_10650 [Gemmatimonadetes bacterium]|nr:hypothetical protein [Gemmatimonadota bacterium]